MDRILLFNNDEIIENVTNIQFLLKRGIYLLLRKTQFNRLKFYCSRGGLA